MQFASLAVIAVAMLASSSPAWSQDVWHTTRVLLPGDVIRQDDIVAQPVPRPLPEALFADRDIVGQQIKRRVPADRPLTEPDVGPRIAVLASAPVTVLWSSGSLRMEMQGRAEESGAVGDEIRILNTQSGQTIRGVVTGDGMTEVRRAQ
ncbi:MAG: flagellar basal body P-ring formation chaperone FlgA [Acetobacteraceae bacterium]|jgi:flagella basal body P-ring formation protein FlgA